MRPNFRSSVTQNRGTARAGKHGGAGGGSSLARRVGHLQSALADSRTTSEILRGELAREAAVLQESLHQLAPVMYAQEEKLNDLQWKLEMAHQDRLALSRKAQMAEEQLRRAVVDLELAREEADEASRRGGNPFAIGIPPRSSSLHPPHFGMADSGIASDISSGPDMSMEEFDDVDHWAGLDESSGDAHYSYGDDEEEAAAEETIIEQFSTKQAFPVFSFTSMFT